MENINVALEQFLGKTTTTATQNIKVTYFKNKTYFCSITHLCFFKLDYICFSRVC